MRESSLSISFLAGVLHLQGVAAALQALEALAADGLAAEMILLVSQALRSF